MPRHDFTRATVSGIGEKTASSIKCKAGKSNIWNASVITEYTASGHDNTLKQLQLQPLSCSVEYLRMVKTNLLRKQLRKCRIKHRNEPESKLPLAVTALERWFMRYQLIQQDDTTQGGGGKKKNKNLDTTPTTLRDPVIPMKCKGTEKVDKDFIKDLMLATDSYKVACAVADEMRNLTHATALELLAAQRLASSQSRSSDTVVVVRHRHSIDVLLKKCPRKLLKINPLHYDKLKTMFERHLHLQEDAAIFDESTFHQALFCLLARYHTIQGHGFQAAVTEHAFDVMHQHFDVTFECFASPLNCRYGAHCSAFPDTDSVFSSLGSFFNFHPTRGSFEANPPFEPMLMQAMTKHITTLLSASSQPLSFLIVVPGWQECTMWDALVASPFKTGFVLLAKDDHGFCDGASHQRRDRYRDSSFDSALFWLQNEAGAARWPVTDTALTDLRQAFALGRPSPAMKKRQDTLGRGSADVCRGVYKGKKANATGEGVMARKAAECVAKKQKC